MSGAELNDTRQEAVGNGGSLRHRITFSTARSLAYVSVLELGRLWERTLRRARVPLKYSQGYNPRPRMHFAAPLPVGCGGEAELLDLSLTLSWTAETLARALQGTTPPDLAVVAVTPVADNAPALSEQLVATEYRVALHDLAPARLEEAVARFLATETLPLPRRGRKHRGKTYDLRPLVHALEVRPAADNGWSTLWMKLNARPGATGRPDEVLKALGLVKAPRRCTRARLLLSDPS